MQQQQLTQPQNQAKQNNIIRKAAIQSFQPIITKIQQHIAFLLAETTKLRQKNEVLQKTVMDHQAIRNEISDIKENMKHIQSQIDVGDKKVQADNVIIKTQMVDITLQIQKINTEMKAKQKRIAQLFEKSKDQKDKLDSTNTNFSEMVEKYCEQVTSLESVTKKQNYELQSIKQQFTVLVFSLGEKIDQKQARLQQNTQKLELYFNEREELRKMIETIYNKVDRSVDIDKYQHDWKIIRMENQNMRKQNRKMIDEALTPEVRQFLPEMMERMTEVRKVNILQKVLNEQMFKNNNFHVSQSKQNQDIDSKLEQLYRKSTQLHEYFSTQNTNLLMQLQQKFQQGSSSATQALQQLQNETKSLLQQKQASLVSQIESLISRNEHQIYNIVYSLIPQEEKDFYSKMKEFIPLLESTKAQILLRCDQITEFGKNLQVKLQSFNNRIVKIKGDMGVDVEALKKKNKIIDNSVVILADNFRNLGKIVSAYSELLLINYSLSFDINQEKQVYVTLEDGIIYEKSQQQNEIFYRKYRTSKQNMRKGALSTLIKLVDQMISKEEFAFLFIKQNKPSQCFKVIKQAAVIKSARKKQRKFSAKKDSSLQNKLPSISETNPNKTIDFNSILKPEDLPASIQSQTLTSDFSNIRKRERGDRRGRYSQLK